VSPDRPLVAVNGEDILERRGGVKLEHSAARAGTPRCAYLLGGV
jgi:hypothetical protein